MAEFKGTIRLEDGDSLETSLTVDRGRLLVAAGEHEIGNWPVKGLAMERRNGDFRFHVEGEELLIAVADPVGFFLTLGIDEENSKTRRSKKPKGVKARPTDVRYSVTYQPYKGKWQIHSARVSVKVKIKSKGDSITSTKMEIIKSRITFSLRAR